jgi:peptidase E
VKTIQRLRTAPYNGLSETPYTIFPHRLLWTAGVESTASSILQKLVIEGKIETIKTRRETLYRRKESPIEIISPSTAFKSFMIQGFTVRKEGQRLIFSKNGEDKARSTVDLNHYDVKTFCEKIQDAFINHGFNVNPSFSKELFEQLEKQVNASDIT